MSDREMEERQANLIRDTIKLLNEQIRQAAVLGLEVKVTESYQFESLGSSIRAVGYSVKVTKTL